MQILAYYKRYKKRENSNDLSGNKKAACCGILPFHSELIGIDVMPLIDANEELTALKKLAIKVDSQQRVLPWL